MKRYYLAYGSNLNISQMRWRCPDARPLGTGFIKNYRLLFKESKTGSYLTIEHKAGHTVPVAVWEVSPSDELRLDAYEGYPRFYYKKELNVQYRGILTKRRRMCKAFVYIMDERRICGLPTKSYMDTCLRGYKDFELDPKVLQKAYEDTLEDMYEGIDEIN